MKSMDTPPTAGSRHASSDAHVIVQSRSPRQVAQIEPACSVLHSASDLHGSFGCSSGFGAAADAPIATEKIAGEAHDVSRV